MLLRFMKEGLSHESALYSFVLLTELAETTPLLLS